MQQSRAQRVYEWTLKLFVAVIVTRGMTFS